MLVCQQDFVVLCVLLKPVCEHICLGEPTMSGPRALQDIVSIPFCIHANVSIAFQMPWCDLNSCWILFVPSSPVCQLAAKWMNFMAAISFSSLSSTLTAPFSEKLKDRQSGIYLFSFGLEPIWANLLQTNVLFQSWYFFLLQSKLWQDNSLLLCISSVLLQ